MPIELSSYLSLERCPHCKVYKPALVKRHEEQSSNNAGKDTKHWAFYRCGNCGKFISAYSESNNRLMIDYFPKSKSVSDLLPYKIREYLRQAFDSLHSPSGAVMLAASAVDAMLKVKNISKGSLYSRIDEAVDKQIITKDMAEWAHKVRLEANDQRHADQEAELPSTEDAKQVVDFADALGNILFVLPARVRSGIEAALTNSN